MSGERKAKAFHRVADETGRLLGISVVECVKHGGHVVPAEIVHQGRQLGVAALFDQPADVALVANLVIETLPPCRPARKNERRVKLVRAVVDPLAQCLAARRLERCLLQRAILENDDLPSEIIEELLITSPKPLANNSIETLAIVIDDPPAIAKALLPAFEQRLEDISF